MNNLDDIQLYCGDCLEVMPTIADKSVDLILCDLPYGVTNEEKSKWDVIVPLDELWREYKRIIKDNGAIVLFAQGIFTAELIMSNKPMFAYTLVWDKQLTTGFLNAKRQPMRVHEDIVVFYKKQPTYNPQRVQGAKSHSIGRAAGCTDEDVTNNIYGDFVRTDNQNDMKYPTSIISVRKVIPSKTVHPTQKPVELMEYLIRTYSNEGDVVLDNCMGSGTTGVACKNVRRKFIGIERDKAFFEIAERRINEAMPFIKLVFEDGEEY